MASIRPLSKYLTDKAASEINEVPKRIPSDIQALRDWLKQETHLIAKSDEQFLIAFLRGCKHSLERSKEKLDSYYTLRTAIPEFFTDRDPTHPDFIELFNKGMACPLPVPLPKGPRLIFVKPGVYDLQRTNFVELMKYSLMVIDRNFVEDDHFNICGYTIILDMEGFSMGHIAQVTLPILKKVAELFKGGYPVRHKGIHFLGFPSGLDAIIHIIMKLLPDKVAKQVYFHSDLKSLKKDLPLSCLPAEYGGKAGTLSEITTNFREKYLSNEKWFLEDAKYKSDESKRRGAPKTANELFGMNGSFRKLDFD